MRGKALLVVIPLLVGMLVGGVVTAVAGTRGTPQDSTTTRGRGICRSVMHTDNQSVTVSLQPAEVDQVSLRNSCGGPVVARYWAQMDVPEVDSAVFGAIVAECLGSGGLSGETCTEGERVVSVPGCEVPCLAFATHHDGQDAAMMQVVFPSLGRGAWRFEAILQATVETSELGPRTFILDAYFPG